MTGADPGGGAHRVRPPKIGKNMIFWREIAIFYTKSPESCEGVLIAISKAFINTEVKQLKTDCNFIVTKLYLAQKIF
jgi:hypothetical protein